MKKLLASTLALLLLSGALSTAMAEDKAGAQPPAMSKEEAAMMEAYAKAGTPGEYHKKLAEHVGSWNTVVTMWAKPGAEPTSSAGSSEIEMIFGGRFQKQTFKGDFAGETFEGFGLTGWDNVQQKYQSIWTDSMSTGMMFSEGKPSKDGKTARFEAKYPDPITGKLQKFEEVFRYVDADSFVMEMWNPDPKGKMFKSMEITYTRKK